MSEASAPLVLLLGETAWPYGPERVAVQARALEAPRCRVEDPERGYGLWVDPRRAAPAEDEGPLGLEAALLRLRPPAAALALTSRGPRPPRPGALEARELALAAVLGAPLPAGPVPSAARTGRPVRLDGTPLAVEPELLAWLDELVLLYEETSAGTAPPDERPDEPHPVFDPADPSGFLAAVAGHGVAHASHSPRERERLRALEAAGLLARWREGASHVVLALARPGRRQELLQAFAEHGLSPLPCRLSGVAGLITRDEEGGAHAP